MQSPSAVSMFHVEHEPVPSIAIRSPFRGTLAVSILSPIRGSQEIVEISSDESPVKRIHPFFLACRSVRAVEPTHEMRFYAIARQQPVPQPVAVPSVPAFPTNRQEGRLRRRVSTPPNLQPHTPIVWIPPRRHGRSDVTTPLVDQLVNLAITTPPRVHHDMDPKVLFPDSPIQTFQDACVQTSPRLLHDMHMEVRNFLIGLGF